MISNIFSKPSNPKLVALGLSVQCDSAALSLANQVCSHLLNIREMNTLNSTMCSIFFEE